MACVSKGSSACRRPCGPCPVRGAAAAAPPEAGPPAPLLVLRRPALARGTGAAGGSASADVLPGCESVAHHSRGIALRDHGRLKDVRRNAASAIVGRGV